MIAKHMRSKAEHAAEWWVRDQCKCVITRTPVRTQFQKVDFFCADVVGKKKDGSHIYVQVTTGAYEAMRQRRRKLEKIPWHPSDEVFLLRLVECDTKICRAKVWAFQIYSYNDGSWHNYITDFIIPNKEWLKKYKDTDND